MEKTYHSYKASDICRRSARYDPARNTIIMPTLSDDAVPVDIQNNTELIFFQLLTTNEKISAAQLLVDTKWRRVSDITASTSTRHDKVL
jgi:hypothetical protein